MLSRTMSGVAMCALSLHLIASILQNTPDSYNLDLRKFVGGWTLPGWRFFAPNPGVHNVHLLVRTGSGDQSDSSMTDWRDVTPQVGHAWTNVLLNPKSRGPKALFDAMQQLSVMGANYSALEWIFGSLPYELVVDASRGLLPPGNDEAFQFLLLNYFPSGEDGKRMLPVLVSKWHAISPTAAVGASNE